LPVAVQGPNADMSQASNYAKELLSWSIRIR
jgi:hypothetical protein